MGENRVGRVRKPSNQRTVALYNVFHTVTCDIPHSVLRSNEKVYNDKCDEILKYLSY